jgi:hypothetical protein
VYSPRKVYDHIFKDPWDRIILEKLKVTQLVKKFRSSLYETQGSLSRALTAQSV